jgi:hypothetical protein
VGSDGGDGPVRNRAREKKVPWASGAQVSREDHRVVAEQDLRSGGALRVRAGAGDAGGTRGSTGGGGGATWKERGRPVQAWGRRRRGRGRHVDGRRAALRRRGWRTWLAGAAAAARAEKQRRRGRGRRRGTGLQFPEKTGIPL